MTDLPPPVQPRYGPGTQVRHISEPEERGTIVAFMVRGQNHSYQVQWGISKCEWHLDFELEPLPEPCRPIGFWKNTP